MTRNVTEGEGLGILALVFAIGLVCIAVDSYSRQRDAAMSDRLDALESQRGLAPIDTLRQGFAEQCEAPVEPALLKESPSDG